MINLDLYVNVLLLLLLLYIFFLCKHSVFIVTLLLEMFWLEAAWWQKLLISECRVTYPEMDTTLRPPGPYLGFFVCGGKLGFREISDQYSYKKQPSKIRHYVRKKTFSFPGGGNCPLRPPAMYGPDHAGKKFLVTVLVSFRHFTIKTENCFLLLLSFFFYLFVCNGIADGQSRVPKRYAGEQETFGGKRNRELTLFKMVLSICNSETCLFVLSLCVSFSSARLFTT